MRSLATWGTLPINLPDPSIHGHAHLEGGIGIDYDPETKEIKVAIVFRSFKDKVKFTRKDSYRILNTRLNVARPTTLIWKGTWDGDPSKVKTELFSTLTKYFKGALFSTCTIAKDDKENVWIHRDGTFVSYYNYLIHNWLVHNSNVKGDPAYTKIPMKDFDGNDSNTGMEKGQFELFSKLTEQLNLFMNHKITYNQLMVNAMTLK